MRHINLKDDQEAKLEFGTSLDERLVVDIA